ncbi:hypothetical protein PAXINDRAFT_14940 [Paxillus involutus ATCC 200175]|uniref:Uncharacterized protein n=1 Tax=Paxillus involutus ATCC 200175 TaxID=664439 RepID=A0A0C9TY41_PAXIN|nr:hypothetical protein PAXINDRAFT_14940 [Paxillus involutus ATCC 200175]
MAEIPTLRTDGLNWPTWRANLEEALDELGIGAYISETMPNPYNEQVNTLAKCVIASTIPDSLFLRILRLKSAYECLETLRNSFKKPTTSTELLREVQNTRTKREATYGLETINDHVRTRTDVRDMSRCDDDDSNRSGRQNNDVPSNKPHHQCQRETRSQGIDKRGCGEGEKDRRSKGKDDEKAAATGGPGQCATDQTIGGVSLIKPTSREKTHLQTTTTHPSPPASPSLLFEQMAPTSRRPTHQRSRNGHVLRNGTRHTREDDVNVVNEDGEDVHIHYAQVEPQSPKLTRQMAYKEAADPSKPNARAGPTEPAGTSHQPLNDVDEGVKEGDRKVEEEDEKGGRASESVALSSNDNGGDKDVRHMYVVPKPAPPFPYHVPPPPDERSPPLSTPLEGENGQKSSGHVDETGTHPKPP